MKAVKLTLIILLYVFLASPARAAQEKDVTREEINQMKQEMQELKALVGDLKAVIKQQKQTIENLGEAQRRQDAAAEESKHAAGDADAHNTAEKVEHTLEDMVKSIKPNISATGDFLANFADDSYME